MLTVNISNITAHLDLVVIPVLAPRIWRLLFRRLG